MSPLQLNNAIIGYKNTLRECKTVGTWVERQTLAENLKIRGKHNYLFPEGPVLLLYLSYSWKL